MASNGVGLKLARIHIIGGPASGKTELARQLGARLGAPIYELDKIAFEGRNFDRRPLLARVTDVNGIAAGTTWITEGMFLGWSDPLLERADVIIWLDCVRWHRAAWRILTRFLRGGLQEVRRQRGIRKISRFRDYAHNMRHLLIGLRSSRDYYQETWATTALTDFGENRRVTEHHLHTYSSKVIHCHSSTELDRLLEQIARERDQSGLVALPKELTLEAELHSA
jgi:adenylate kinase family enzyme